MTPREQALEASVNSLIALYTADFEVDVWLAIFKQARTALGMASEPEPEWLPTADATIEAGDWVLLRGKDMGRVVTVSARKASVTLKNGMCLRVFKSEITHVRKAAK